MWNHCFGSDSARNQLTQADWRRLISLLVPAHLDPLYRRHHRRYPLTGSVVLCLCREAVRRELCGSLCNVSESGILVTAEQALPVGDDVTLLFDLMGITMHSHGHIRHFTHSVEGCKIGIELDFQHGAPTTV